MELRTLVNRWNSEKGTDKEFSVQSLTPLHLSGGCSNSALGTIYMSARDLTTIRLILTIYYGYSILSKSLKTIPPSLVRATLTWADIDVKIRMVTK
jgi:hypothetical protein